MIPARVKCKFFQLSVAVIILLLTIRDVCCCGLDWKTPVNHFDGVDPQGHVSYWEQIAEVDCGDGLKLPLQINFNSGRDMGSPSPYLGQGWLLPFLESRFVQEGEDRFRMLQPDGLNNPFERSEVDGKILEGSAGWKAEIHGTTITAWADCGWKIVFVNGHIASMSTPKGRRLDWIYEGERVSEVREGSVVRLKVEYGSDGSAVAVVLAIDKRILIVHDKKPRVQTIAGQNVITGVDDSLAKLTLADGEVHSFGFGIDHRMMPKLEVAVGRNKESASRQFSWNSQTKLIVGDNDWTYQITPAANLDESAFISRSNTKMQHESWKYDDAQGMEITEDVNGTKRVRYWFVSGPLTGCLRKIEETTNGVTSVTRKVDYDAAGNIIRDEDHGRFIVHAANGSVLSLDSSAWASLHAMHNAANDEELRSGSSKSSHDHILYKQALNYIDSHKNIDDIILVINQIADEDMRTTAYLTAVDSDDDLTTQEKVSKIELALPRLGRQALRSQRLLEYYKSLPQ